MSKQRQMPMQSPTDLFVHELSAMRSGEQTIVRLLEEAQPLVQDQQLKEALRMHAEQSRMHAQRLERIMQNMGAQPHPVRCFAIEGMIQDLQVVQQSGPSREVLEGCVTGAVRKTENFEIAAYMGLTEKARALGLTQAAALLEQNLTGDQQTLRACEHLAMNMTQRMVSMTDLPGDQQSGAPTI